MDGSILSIVEMQFRESQSISGSFESGIVMCSGTIQVLRLALRSTLGARMLSRLFFLVLFVIAAGVAFRTFDVRCCWVRSVDLPSVV